MKSDSIDELILDTLYFRRTAPDPTCLQTNVAGQELEQQSADSLPAIERVLTNVVVPYFIGLKNDHPFHGLSNLLGAYLLIGSRCDTASIVRFLRTLPATLQAEVVANVPVFFRNAKFLPQFTVMNGLKTPPDEQLLSFVEESSRAENQILREKAKRAMSFLVVP